MSGRRKNQLRVLGGVLGACLMTVGCQAQFSFLGGPLDSRAPGHKDQGTQGAQGQPMQPMQSMQPMDQAIMPASGQMMDRPDSVNSTTQAISGLMQASYLTADRPDKGKPVPPPMPAPLMREPEQSGPCTGPAGFVQDNAPVPVELRKASMPPYVIEPPDILLIDAV